MDSGTSAPHRTSAGGGKNRRAKPARARATQPADDRLIALVAGIATAAPERTLQQIAAQLEAMRERTSRGGTRWHPSSLRNLLLQAERRGLVQHRGFG
jgi:hypothetical protein